MPNVPGRSIFNTLNERYGMEDEDEDSRCAQVQRQPGPKGTLSPLGVRSSKGDSQSSSRHTHQMYSVNALLPVALFCVGRM